MSIRFAAARSRSASGLAPTRCYWALPTPANDRGVASPANATERDRTLRLALRHFAEHGLAAAERARDLALRAWSDGEAETCRQWLAVCAMLDRRLAAATRREVCGD